MRVFYNGQEVSVGHGVGTGTATELWIFIVPVVVGNIVTILAVSCVMLIMRVNQ